MAEVVRTRFLCRSASSAAAYPKRPLIDLLGAHLVMLASMLSDAGGDLLSAAAAQMVTVRDVAGSAREQVACCVGTGVRQDAPTRDCVAGFL